jgi:hypothetical protein
MYRLDRPIFAPRERTILKTIFLKFIVLISNPIYVFEKEYNPLCNVNCYKNDTILL